jgi:hypothetical protein
MDTVSSVDPESSTITSLHKGSIDATQRRMRSASFLVMTTPDRGNGCDMRGIMACLRRL